VFDNVLNRITYHAVYDDSILDALHYARDNGFFGVQVAVETPHLSFERLSDRECDEIKEFVSQNGLWLSLHGPDETGSLFETSSLLTNGIFNYYAGLFSFAERTGARMVTVHLGKMTPFRTDNSPEQVVPEVDLALYEAALKTNLQRLIDLAAGRFVLCVESYNLDATALSVLQPRLDSGELFLCWDLAKTFNRGATEVEDYFRLNLGCVKQVHLHDVNSEGRSHRVIGSGRLDFPRYLSRLSAADVLEYCIEVRPREKAKESLENLKSIVGARR